MFLVYLESFWILSFVFCLSFLLCFWVASARFSGISVFVGPCFLKINFEQHWQSLSAVQNYSSKIQAPRNCFNNSWEDILWMPFLHQPPTHSLPWPFPKSLRILTLQQMVGRAKLENFCPYGWDGLDFCRKSAEFNSPYQQSRAAPPRSRHCATFLAMPPTSFSGAG